MKTSYIKLSAFIIITLVLTSCRKDEFLNAKPSSNLVVPSTIADIQAMLEYNNSAASGSMNVTPAIGEASTDIYYMTFANWQSAKNIDRNTYIWSPDIWENQGQNRDWNDSYNQIYKANLALEYLNESIRPDNTPSSLSNWNYTRAAAYFYRAYAYFNLSEVFIPYYDSLSADKDLGLPLKLNSDLNMTVDRSSVKQTFDQIFLDLRECRSTINNNLPGPFVNRPSKTALYGLYSRIYLYLRNYPQAGLYADSALQISSNLIDFNSLSSTGSFPFTSTNIETFYQTNLQPTNSVVSVRSSSAFIDSNLYVSYTANDLRKQAYFIAGTNNATALIRGNYSGIQYLFSGLATDEMYLNRSECFARNGNISAAMTDLNTLLIKRWKTGTYISLTAVTQNDALNKILAERKKEMLFRQRWPDLRRLNKEGANITITRNLNGQTFTLSPGSKLYVLPIPPDEIALSGIAQNSRF